MWRASHAVVLVASPKIASEKLSPSAKQTQANQFNLGEQTAQTYAMPCLRQLSRILLKMRHIWV
jgi:hypothetical protein